jgi:Bacterial Ig-like domain
VASRTLHRILLFVFSAIVVGGCAEVAPPPGGEIDKTSPRIVSSNPPNLATSVSPASTIDIQFSENVSAPVGRAVFISPRPLRDPKIKWKGDRLQITLGSNFAPDRTYVVSLMRGVADLRGNQIDSLAQLAFTTGSSLDSGRISGVVEAGGKPAAGVFVGLFSMDVVSKPSVVWDSLFPIYLTTTSKMGEFDLRYLPSTELALVAFADVDRNDRVNIGVDPFGIPDRRVIPLPSGAAPMLLKMITADTARPQVLSASWTSDNLLRIRLAKPLFVQHPRLGTTAIDMRADSDSTVVFHARGVLEPDTLTTVVTATFDVLPLGKYHISFTFDTLLQPLVYAPLMVDSTSDKTPPRLLSFSLNTRTLFTPDSAAIFTFSEPIDRTPFLDSAFAFVAGEGAPVVTGGNWIDPFRYRLKASDFEEGQRYTIAVDLPRLRDRAGNACGDSVQQFSFTRMNSDSLGTVTGEVQVDSLIDGAAQASADILLSFERIGTSQQFGLRVSQKKFSISLPGGKYVVSALVDRDGNGQFTGGRLIPYSLAETVARHSDTIAVRPRFETSGITIQVK